MTPDEFVGLSLAEAEQRGQEERVPLRVLRPGRNILTGRRVVGGVIIVIDANEVVVSAAGSSGEVPLVTPPDRPAEPDDCVRIRR